MGKKNNSVDNYIAKAADFAKPILKHLRDLVHWNCREVTETMKWSFPHFEYKGVLCSMAAFKEHCAFGFWKASVMKDPHNLLSEAKEKAMGQMGRITKLSDLPTDKILGMYIREAVRVNEAGIKVSKPTKKREKKKLEVPQYFMNALKKNKNALAVFEGFSPSNKRDYVEWIVDAKTEETRSRRLKDALQWMSEGKRRNWKYERN